MSDLRKSIAEALRAHTYAGKGAPDQTCKSTHGLECDCPERCVCGAVFEYWDDHFADVAAGVVGPEIAERDVALARVRQLADDWSSVEVGPATLDRDRWLKLAGGIIRHVIDGSAKEAPVDDG